MSSGFGDNTTLYNSPTPFLLIFEVCERKVRLLSKEKLTRKPTNDLETKGPEDVSTNSIEDSKTKTKTNNTT